MQVPCHIGLNGVQPKCTHLLQTIAPVFGDDTKIVHGAGKNTEELAIEQELAASGGEGYGVSFLAVGISMMQLSVGVRVKGLGDKGLGSLLWM